MDAELLIKENMGRLISAARKLSRNFGVPELMDDLIQEGSLALMEAAENFDPSGEASFASYSGKIIKSAMLDYIYRNATPFTVPPDRYRILRRAAGLLADSDDAVQELCDTLNVTPASARRLILDCREIFSTVSLDEADTALSSYGNPELVYTEKLLRSSIHAALDSLPSRSRTIIKYYLGIDQPDEKTMTFQELAIRLNYNSPSGVEKAYKRAVEELRRQVSSGEYGQWRSALRLIQRKLI